VYGNAAPKNTRLNFSYFSVFPTFPPMINPKSGLVMAAGTHD
jgi:hypothetical protein